MNEPKEKAWDFINPKWKLNIVVDEKYPELYSRQVINIFSLLFSVFFGGVLLVINLRKTNNEKGILPVLIFSFTYTVLMIVGLSYVSIDMGFVTIALNALGATVLYNFFWTKYIGKEFKYRTGSFWIPLIIGLAISFFIVWVIISTDPA